MATPPNSPISAAKSRRAVELCEAGKGRNAIADELGIGAATVSRIIRDAGLTFDRSATKAATAARKADSASRRAELAGTLLDKAQALLAEMDRPFLAFNIGGKDNVYTEHQLDHAPTVDKKNLMQAASIALQRHLDIERHDADEKAADAKSMLTQLGAALGVQPVGTP